MKSKFGKLIYKVLASIGRNTIIYLCVHQLIILLIQHWTLTLSEKNIIIKIGVKIIFFIMVLIICKLFAIVCEYCKPLRVIFGMKTNDK